ncbi:MAG: hypothetical protein AAGA35_01375 [Patescibacteria group bacterium]
MKRLVCFLTFFFLPVVAIAFSVERNELPQQYAVYDVEQPTDRIQYLGELVGFPDTYQFVLRDPAPFQAHILAYQDGEIDPTFSVILVREKDRGGVTEIMRLKREDGEWIEVTDPDSRIDYLSGEVFEGELEPGVYRLEVSNPENLGQYALWMGTEESGVGYFSSLASIRSAHAFHGYSIFKLFTVSRVYLPLGILLLLGLMYATWRYRNRPLHAD